MKITNRLNLPQPFVSAVTREYTYTPKRYSVTQILKGTREAILQRRHDDEIESDVADMAWLIFGTAVHGILENAQETDTQLKENKIVVDMPNGYQLSGIFDLYDDSTGTVTDYKTASVWKVMFNEWDDYRTQTLIYCWMLRRIGFDAKRGEVVAMLKDHSKTKAMTEPDYPNYPIYRIGWDFDERDFEVIGDWLYAKFLQLAMAEHMPDNALPLCTEQERWHKGDTWAVKKKGNKRAARVLDSEEAANEYADALHEKDGKAYEVEFRPGEDAKCLKYCPCREFCNHYMKLTTEVA